MNEKKLTASWTFESKHDLETQYSIPTNWQRIVYKWHSKIPTTCRCMEVHPIWKYVKNVFEFIFHKPDSGAILEHDIIQKMSDDIAYEIDNEILKKVLNPTDDERKQPL